MYKNYIVPLQKELNLVAQINSKIGYTNFKLPIAKVESLLGFPSGELCIFGVDVCHGNTQDSIPSVVALCSSYTSDFTKFYTSLSYQSPRQEIIEDLGDTFQRGLEVFQQRNGFLPKYILFYRDGVGEGMYDEVCAKEITSISEILHILYKTLPKLTFVVVQKRNHFRSVIEKDGESYNPPVGTVVEKIVVDKDNKNFYLYSHKALQGTARPTHYQIIRDDIQFDIRKFADFTYGLCHLHQACTRSVSIPPVIFCADKACGKANACYKFMNKYLVKEELKFRPFMY